MPTGTVPEGSPSLSGLSAGTGPTQTLRWHCASSDFRDVPLAEASVHPESVHLCRPISLLSDQSRCGSRVRIKLSCEPGFRIISRLRQAACLKHSWITLLLYATRQLRVQLKASALAPSLDGCFRIGAAGPGILPRLPGDALPAILGRNEAAIKPQIEPQQGASTRRTLIVPYLADRPRGVCFNTKGAGAAPARVPRRLRLGPGLCSAPRSRRRPQPALETGPPGLWAGPRSGLLGAAPRTKLPPGPAGADWSTKGHRDRARPPGLNRGGRAAARRAIENERNGAHWQ